LNELIRTRLDQLNRAGALPILRTGLKGLEKESLRITPDGAIASTPHPPALGSALTHPYITTDYSEALIELVTPPFADAAETLAFLDDLHQFVYQHIGDEMLLATSMPGRLTSEECIPIGRYGTSNIGRMKSVYRQGLAYRYGRAMQAIAGVHFNYSVDETLWPVYRDILARNDESLGDFIGAQYFGIIRNIHRYGWLLLYLFGCSPALCKSFFMGSKPPTACFAEFDPDTYFRAHATSLRMSDIGYKNDSQSGVDISFDDLDSYVASLTRAINTPYPPYERIGVKVAGEYRQLNANLLQIENEYYSPVRPKQVIESGEKPTLALKRRGVRYLELRSVDLNSFHPDGIGLDQLHFLENFLLYCLLEDSPPLDQLGRREASRNALDVACCGRTPGFTILEAGTKLPLGEQAERILDGMAPIAEVLDGDDPSHPYTSALALQQDAIRDPDSTPSARQLRELRMNGLSFADYGLVISAIHAERFRGRRLDPASDERLTELSIESLDQQRKLEAADSLEFDEFLSRYFNQS
jgi:glutamate--cysteine ligase